MEALVYEDFRDHNMCLIDKFNLEEFVEAGFNPHLARDFDVALDVLMKNKISLAYIHHYDFSEVDKMREVSQKLYF